MTAAWCHPSADVENGVDVGDGTRIWARTHVRRGARIGSECTIGDAVFIDVDVRLGSRCKVQNNALIYHGSVVDDEVFIGPAACLANDRFPRAATPDGRIKDDSDWTVAGVTVHRGASIGAHAVVVGGVTVGAFAMVGAGAVVTRDVAAHALVAGVPARPMGWVCRCGHQLDAALTCPVCTRRYVSGECGLTMVEP
jgi:UDP-2-acetamido-3-amino-2,3-dideoxy-glucuronate N-acetyltransferase